MNRVVRLKSRKRASIAGRARKLVDGARIEWDALALRLGMAATSPAPMTVGGPDQPRAASLAVLGSSHLASVRNALAEGVYRVDAEAVATRLIARLLQQARTAH